MLLVWTEFGKTACDTAEYNYAAHFRHWHTSAEMEEFLLRLYDSSFMIGRVDRKTFEFRLCKPVFPYAEK